MISRGHTLVELLVVLAICMLGGMYVVSEVCSYRSVHVRAEVDALYMLAAAYAQRAVCERTLYRLEYRAPHWYCKGQRVHTVVSSVAYGLLDGVLGPPSSPQHHITSPITLRGRAMEFYPDGTAQAGTVYLVDDARTVLYAVSFPVGSVSYLRRYRYYEGQWKVIS